MFNVWHPPDCSVCKWVTGEVTATQITNQMTFHHLMWLKKWIHLNLNPWFFLFFLLQLFTLIFVFTMIYNLWFQCPPLPLCFTIMYPTHHITAVSSTQAWPLLMCQTRHLLFIQTCFRGKKTKKKTPPTFTARLHTWNVCSLMKQDGCRPYVYDNGVILMKSETKWLRIGSCKGKKTKIIIVAVFFVLFVSFYFSLWLPWLQTWEVFFLFTVTTKTSLRQDSDRKSLRWTLRSERERNPIRAFIHRHVLIYR